MSLVLLVILFNRMTCPLKLLKSQNLIVVMLNITSLTVNFYFLGKSIFVMLTITSDNSFPKNPLQSPLPILIHRMVGPQKACDYFPSEIITY